MIYREICEAGLYRYKKRNLNTVIEY
ncbi:hypothetical protein EMIT0P2_110174 [Pseudomonas sp. IT-P2]